MKTQFEKASVIDVHAHIVLKETFGVAGKVGPELGDQDGEMPWFRVGDYRLDGVRYENSPFMSVDLRLVKMDEAGIDCQVVSPNPLTFLHHIPKELAISFCRIHNDALSKTISGQGRLHGFAALPIQDLGASVEELDRAVKECGLLGGYIGTDGPFALDSEEMNILYEKCLELDVPLFIHPSPAGIDGPKGDKALDKYDLDVVVGFAAQETLAVARLIFGGVLERFPNIDICISHGGGSTGYLFGRMEMAARKRPWASPLLKKDGGFAEQLGKLWFDNHLNNAGSLDLLTRHVGSERVVFGTNFSGWDAPNYMTNHKPDLKLAQNARRLLRVS